MRQDPERAFVVDLLLALRRDHFSLRAWGSFLQRSWRRSCQTASANPSLLRSWRHFTYIVAFLTLAVLIGNGLSAGIADTLHLLPGFFFCVAWQQCDLFWHLGLNRAVHSGELLPDIGGANRLTWLRGLGASYLLGRLTGGLVTPPVLALAIFLCGGATDILDGHLARRTATRTRLGQFADAEADLCLSVSLTLILLADGVLPLWVGLVILLRFVLPLTAALLSYLLYARPLAVASTGWGKGAGLAQCLYFLALLAPAPLAGPLSLLRTLLLIATLSLLLAAPLAQIAAQRKTRRRAG
ncbi:MAG TPA: CDP-alcohol phosphatidyltransferase family protein [Ktedonobacteraceae bacterium]|jgi:phosphatidylglycerophosphate synthase